MVVHFIFLGGMIALAFAIGYFIGGKNFSGKIGKLIPNGNIDKICAENLLNSIKNRCNEISNRHLFENFYEIIVFAILVTMFICSYANVREHYINQFKSKDVVECIEYKYKKINGEKILTDSTMFYTKNKK